MDVENHTKKAWEFYCSKYGIDFKIINKSSHKDMAPHWERYNIMELYPEYDNYLYVDADAIVKWDAPNFFEELPETKLYAVKDLGSLEWTYNSIQGYQDMFPDVSVYWWEYITTGFLKFDKSHRVFFRDFLNFHKSELNEFNQRQYTTLKKGFDQTPFNFFIRKNNIELITIPEIFSLGHLNKKDILNNGMFLNIPSYIWQFNGIPKEQLPSLMDQVWDHIKEQYQ